MSCTKMIAAVAKNGSNCSHKYILVASPSVSKDQAETQSLPKFSQTGKLLPRDSSDIGKPHLYSRSFFSDCDGRSTLTQNESIDPDETSPLRRAAVRICNGLPKSQLFRTFKFVLIISPRADSLKEIKRNPKDLLWPWSPDCNVPP